jgi:hypothetical protein
VSADSMSMRTSTSMLGAGRRSLAAAMAPRPTMAGLIASGAVSLARAVESTDAAGEPTVLTTDAAALKQHTMNAIAAREAAWRQDPHCTECGRVIDAPDHAGLIETTGGPRVACRRPCFVHAIRRLNPTLSTSAATSRAEASR